MTLETSLNSSDFDSDSGFNRKENVFENVSSNFELSFNNIPSDFIIGELASRADSDLYYQETSTTLNSISSNQDFKLKLSKYTTSQTFNEKAYKIQIFSEDGTKKLFDSATLQYFYRVYSNPNNTPITFVPFAYRITHDGQMTGTFSWQVSEGFFSAVEGPNCVDEETTVTCLDENMKEKEIKIKDLRPGQDVKTYKDGFLKIRKIGFMKSINQDCRYVLRKTPENGLTEDLYVSSRHLILTDSITPEQQDKEIETFGKIFMVHDKYLVQARHHADFEPVKEQGFHTYYQLSLENGGDIMKRHGVWTNGYLTETTCQHDWETHLKDLEEVE